MTETTTTDHLLVLLIMRGVMVCAHQVIFSRPLYTHEFVSGIAGSNALAKSPSAKKPASLSPCARIEVSKTPHANGKYESANLLGENAANLGIKSITDLLTMRRLER